MKVELKTTGAGVVPTTTKVRGKDVKLTTTVPLKVAASGTGTIEMNALIAYCNDGDGAVCKIDSVKRLIPFEIRAGGAKEIRVAATLK